MSLTIRPARIVEESSSPLLAAHESWERRPLAEVAEILNGYAFASKLFRPGEGKPLIRIRDIFDATTTVGFLGAYDPRYLVHSDELLVGMDGDFHCARWQGPEALLNQRVCKVTPDPKHLDLDFLTHLLPGYLQAIHDLTSSTTVTHL
jgi:type I restriction enzyme, S subunit